MIKMSDIAVRAGVSRATVSFVLSGRQTDVRISESTRERVLAAAAELGYLPNSSARAMRQGKFGCVALLMSNLGHRSTLPYSLLGGIQDALSEHDLHLALATLPDTKLADTGYVPKMLREWMADGMLINYLIGIPEPLVQMVRQHSVPSMWINVQQPSDCVYPNDLDAGIRATQHLLSLGHRRIAYVDYSFGSKMEETLVHYSTRDRESGYRQVMHAAGLAPQVIRDIRALERREYVPFTLRWLEGADRPTAVIAYTPAVASAVLHTAMAHRRLQVPQDLSLVTFHDRAPDDLGIAVTTMLLPEHALGQAAVRGLIEKIADPAVPLDPNILPLGFDPGATCAPPPPDTSPAEPVRVAGDS
jgi:LacI family transcriptional regulator